MSGKSTLLRAVGTNIVLALMGAPVRAEQLTVSVVRLGATLRVEDSLQDGRSRFLAEVERVRAILEVGRAKEPLVLFLDELFSGTNSADRCAGAAGLLRELLTLHVIGFVTTHDLALTSLTETLADVQNVHFTDAFGANPNAYQMQPGVVPAGNGLALMRACGFDV
jgi:DNA mismatch repair ATPase MutS